MRHRKSCHKLSAPWRLSLIASVFFASGCGSSTTYPIVPATGNVKYEDGTLIPAYRIQAKFISEAPPLDKKTHPRPGLGEVNVDDGSFAVSTYDFEDGLIRGKHKVTVRSYDEKNLPSGEIPEVYASPDSSPLEVDASEYPFELRIQKP